LRVDQVVALRTLFTVEPVYGLRLAGEMGWNRIDGFLIDRGDEMFNRIVSYASHYDAVEVDVKFVMYFFTTMQIAAILDGFLLNATFHGEDEIAVGSFNRSLLVAMQELLAYIGVHESYVEKCEEQQTEGRTEYKLVVVKNWKAKAQVNDV